MKRVAVVGGGVAGVAAAWEAARQMRAGAAVEVALFEASGRLGGIVETVCEQGFVIEAGPDAWVTEKPWAAQAANDLGLGGELLASNDAGRKTHLLLGGTLTALPDGMRLMVPGDLAAIEASPLFTATAKAAYRREPLRAQELRDSAPAADESIADLVRRHFGEEVLQTVAAPLMSGILGGNVEHLSARAILPAFVAMEREYGSLIEGLRAGHATRGPGSAAIFTTLRGGLGKLIEAMVTEIPASWVRRCTPVTALQRTGTGWLVASVRGQEAFDIVFMAAPVHVARELLLPVDEEMARLMAMEATSAIVVGLGYRAPCTLPAGFGFLVPKGSGYSLLACTFMDQKFAGRVPPGGNLLRAFFGGEAAIALREKTDDEIVALARQELGRILGDLPHPEVTLVRRWPRSLPQYRPGHLDRMAALDDRVHQLGALSLLGNGYRGVGIPDLIRDSRAAVHAIVAAST